MIKLSDESTALWAKKNTEDGQQLWLPLIAHLTDTQEVIKWLYNNWLSDSQRDFLKQNLSDEEVHKLVKFLGFVHDLGKATPAFQIKKSHNNDKDLDEKLLDKLAMHGFSQINELNLESSSQSPHNVAGEALLLKFKVPENIAALIGGHHGKPLNHSPITDICHHETNYWQSTNNQHIKHVWQKVQKELFEYGLNSSGYKDVSELPKRITQPEAVILEGLIIMADWLASTEYMNNNKNEPLFPLIDLDKSWDSISSEERLKKAIKNWKLNDYWEPQKIDKIKDPYDDRWEYKARPVQKKMTETIGQAYDPGMIIIEAPMGIGKTEIALIAVEQLAYISGQNGLFMGLPTQATSNAMFNRVEYWLNKLAKSQENKFSFKLMHSKAQFNEDVQKLPKAENIEADAGAVVVNDWFSGKKTILNEFTIGTIDNLLSMGLKQKHLFLKHLGLSGKVIVIDEVHAYDAYMSQYLYKVIKWLGAYKVSIIILSATLPQSKREMLINQYLRGKYHKKPEKVLNAPDNWQKNQAYPLLSILDGCELKQVSDFPGQSDQKPQELQVKRLNLADEDLIDNIMTKIDGGGVAGLIVNTVKRAQALAKLVAEQDVELMVLHSSFLAPDRTEQEKKLQGAIGKEGKRPEKLVVIGTQVLEQSLDIDFDVLYTDIAPMDLLLQRAGRLHRHNISRPETLQQPQLYVMGINDFGDYGDANEAVYHKYLLIKTDYFLQDKIALPDDISRLVQKVYGSETDEEIDGIAAAKTDFDNYVETEEDKAGEFQICDPQYKKSIHRWLSNDKKGADVSEQRASAAVRDIKETLEVILLKHTTKGDFLLDGRNIEQVPAQEIAQQLIRLPTAITPNPEKIISAIEKLERRTCKYYSDWQDNVWLRGALVLQLDSNLSTVFDIWNIQYSKQLGLIYSKEDDHDGKNI
ncbi:CRISPR-associated helicase Cas3' [Lactobacillus sp. ESL0684]|uniref:CRISPR-associated helicase Cas3' n=1 Tax=Lactobacillus sp. ESL0684 TaxID=2983213 RepID=UPI0023F7291B|nr:CRISPR-associated helicase Cas3' [Lactobacillus sp. ESL0684]WEV43558.1 CRISPR-associated helicase Cas3' [Lactobacillus sp. ESL0684]